MSVVGSQVRSALQQKQAADGVQSVQAIVNQFGGTGASLQAVQSLFSSQQQEEVAQAASEKTGINPAQIQALLPTLIPLVLNFLKTGSNAQNPEQGLNPVLSGFLDSDGDGDVDMGDLMKLAGKFMG